MQNKKRVYKIKTSDFANMQNVKQITDTDDLQIISDFEKQNNCKIVKALKKASQFALFISSDAKYFVVCKSCYVKSLRDILLSVGILSNDIIIKTQVATNDFDATQLASVLSVATDDLTDDLTDD